MTHHATAIESLRNTFAYSIIVALVIGGSSAKRADRQYLS
jgi:hypothetical protein